MEKIWVKCKPKIIVVFELNLWKNIFHEIVRCTCVVNHYSDIQCILHVHYLHWLWVRKLSKKRSQQIVDCWSEYPNLRCAEVSLQLQFSAVNLLADSVLWTRLRFQKCPRMKKCRTFRAKIRFTDWTFFFLSILNSLLRRFLLLWKAEISDSASIRLLWHSLDCVVGFSLWVWFYCQPLEESLQEVFLSKSAPYTGQLLVAKEVTPSHSLQKMDRRI